MARELLRFPPNSSTGLSLVAVGIIAAVTGIHQQSAPLIAFAVTLLLGPAVVFFTLRRTVRGLHLLRTAPHSAFEEETVEVTLELENGAHLPVFYPQVCEIFPPEIHSQKELLFAGRILPGERVERRYRGYCLLPRGIYTIGPTAVRVSDPFGWFELRKFFGSRQSLKVYPRVHRFGIHDRVGQCVAHITSPLSRSVRGDSTDFLSVREYHTGDSWRRIHWGLTAHLGYPVVREFARAAAGDLCIVIDLCTASLVGLGRNSSLEHSVKIAASVSAQALRRGRRVQLIAGSRVPPGTGAAQQLAILEVLVVARPTDDEPPLPVVLERVGSVVGGGVTLVMMMSPYLQRGDREGLALEAHLAGWRRRGHRVVVVLFDDATFRNLREFRAPDEEGPSLTWQCTERLRAQGIETFAIPCGADLAAAFAGVAG